MMPTPAEVWMTFALDDLDGADILFREGKFNLTCSHAQQAAEKVLKSFLVYNNISYPKIHDLDALNKLCSNVDSSFTSLKEQLAVLTQFYAPSKVS